MAELEKVKVKVRPLMVVSFDCPHCGFDNERAWDFVTTPPEEIACAGCQAKFAVDAA